MPIDLRSDTVTKPTPAMRRAMAEAEVGDDVLDGDPTVRRLETRVAEMLRKDKALFFPSGTMANQTAIWLLSRPGTEVLLDAEAHIVHYEGAGAAAWSGVQLRLVRGQSGVMRASDLGSALRPDSVHVPRASMVALENTHNGAGGVITPLEELRELSTVARKQRLPVHLDGARLWNASVASGTALSDFAAVADTVMVSFSKGLGAPVGAALAGDEDVMREAWRARRRFGGAMRQSGILAAAALHGLDTHFQLLARDHEKARVYARRVDGVCGARVVSPDTNIVMLDLPGGYDANVVVSKARENGVLLVPWSPSRIRAVMHLDVSEEDVARAADIVAEAIEAMPRATR
ncbi:MAG TPA: GntG family PLP-dependent aldolase [Gemmatimonadaceae bacterium]|nr:GntG family PLP-dependent aldolase [Gemmatimonadaceae bacterium]